MASNPNLAQIAESSPKMFSNAGEEAIGRVNAASIHDPPDDASVAESNSSNDSGNSSSTKGRTRLHKLLLEMENNPSGPSKNYEFFKCLKESTDEEINCPDGSGKTPLHIAARGRLVPPVIELLRIKSIERSIHHKDNKQRQPLHHACLKGDADIIRRLLEKEADIEATMRHGSRPIHEACWSGVLEAVDLLLTWEPKPADPSAVSETGWSPMIVAVYDEHEKIVKRLLKEPHLNLSAIEDDFGLTALNLAINRGNETIVDDLLQRPDIDFRQDYDKWTPLYTATQRGELAIMKKLLKFESDGKVRSLETHDSRGFTPLLSACENGFTEGVELLINAGANYNAQSDSHSTPLIEASRGNHVEAINALLGSKDPAKIDLADLDGRTALHTASYEGHCQIADLLISKGADIDLKDNYGQGALQLAIMQCNKDVVQLLLNKKPKVDLKDGSCQSLLNEAFETGGMGDITLSIVKHIARTGSDKQKDETLAWAAEDFARHEGVKLLLSITSKASESKGPHKTSKWSAIEWAAYGEHARILVLLLRSSPHNSATRQMVQSAQHLMQQKQSKESKSGSRDKKVVKGKSNKEIINKPKTAGAQSGDSRTNRDLVDIILQDPSIFLVNTDSKIIEPPSATYHALDLISDYDAAIIQIYRDEDEGKSASIHRYRTVKQTIYGEGPTKLMQEANDNLRSMLDKFPQDTGDAIFKKLKLNYDKSAVPSLTWIHLPLTNITWMDDLFTSIMIEEKEDVSNYERLRAFFRDSWVEVPDQDSPLRSMRPRFVERPQEMREKEKVKDEQQKNLQKAVLVQEGSEEEEKGGEEEGKAKKKDVNSDVNSDVKRGAAIDNGKKGGEEAKGGLLAASAIYMPYLSFSTYCPDGEEYHKEDQTHKSKTHKEEPEVHEACKKAKERYENLLGEYNGSAFHGFPTLDEWYYQFAPDDKSKLESEDDRQVRNKSQVITKGLNPYGIKSEHWRLLRVNQLWLWAIGDKWLITATNDPIDGSKDRLSEGVLEALDKKVKIGGTSFQPKSSMELSKLIVDHCIGFYEKRPKKASKDEPSNNSDEEKRESFSVRQSFSNFVNDLGRRQTQLINQFASQSATAGDIETTSNKNVLTGSEMRMASQEAEALSCGIKDVRDELNILKSVANHQNTVQKGLATKFSDTRQDTLAAKYVLRDIEEMEKVAERIESAGEPQVDTARSLQQGQESVRQGRILMIFTVVTILFLPLSFLSSLFALDVASFREAPGWAFAIIFAVSFTVSLPLAVYAYLEEVTHSTLKTWRAIKGIGKDKPGKNDNPAVPDGLTLRPTRLNGLTQLSELDGRSKHAPGTINRSPDHGVRASSGTDGGPVGSARRNKRWSSSQTLHKDVEKQ
ncbi:uncharacterized protein FRV6_07019 [Fusarium oxysporum]|uniref:Uncharacterized protein n=1 Tax=Fusarium oxysporum TaxID=5507 RepID=A0A2H3T275_FUSOX|nr:uncharacterized protein FRV6_07019 [Fusarium oxysporum]